MLSFHVEFLSDIFEQNFNKTYTFLNKKFENKEIYSMSYYLKRKIVD